MKNIIIVLIGVVLIASGLFYYLTRQNTEDPSYEKPVVPEVTEAVDLIEEEPIVAEEETGDVPTRGAQSVIGSSLEERDIVAYHFGTGAKEVLFVGGVHGGYSWNTALLGYELIDWLTENPTVVPEDVTVTVIPVLNPDGLTLITGTANKFTTADVSGSQSDRVAARFNSRDVDLNRNFDCEWESVGTWQDQNVSGGSQPFSEPESQALRDYVTTYTPTAAVTWYSAAGGVYSSNCKNGVSTDTKELTELFAKASGYTAHAEFDYYEITGDLVNWMAGQNIPAISVLLTDHENTELTKNKAGIEAILTYVANKN